MNKESKKKNAKKKKPGAAETLWDSYSKTKKVFFFIGVGVTFVILSVLVFLFFSRQLGMSKLADLLFGKDMDGWGWLSVNLTGWVMKFFLTLFIIGLAITVSFLLDLIISLISWKGKRSRTVGSLIRSLVRYAFWILVIGSILSVWGLDVGSIVAGLGIITLVIGLGCQSLIADIVSGIFIVFDDFFDVDDVVVIDTFRGTITSIGLRCTKLVDWAGNIKSINNSEIKTVINLSRLASSFFVYITVDKEEDLEKVESIIACSLKGIGQTLPKLVGEIAYKGVKNLDENGITLAFLASALEGDRYQVTRDIKRELFLLMRRNHIEVPFKKVHVVNEPNDKDRPTSSAEEKEEAAKLNESNRIILKEEDE